MKSFSTDTFLDKLPEILVILLSALLPISLMILWQVNNNSLPISDANDFIGTAGKISNLFNNGEFLEGLKSLYSEKPWRPLSFHLIVFPFMLISKNNILFSSICVHTICIFFIVYFSYYIFRKNCSSKLMCFYGSTFIGLLSSSFFPGGMIMFSETAFTPAILGTIYYLYYSDYLRIKKYSILFLVAILIAFTLRPIESVLYLAPILFYFFYLGYNNKVFSTSLITNIFKTILIAILILSLRGLDIEIDNRFEKIGDSQAISLYENLLIVLTSIILLIFFPSILKNFKRYIHFIKNSKQRYNNSYALFVFTIFSFVMLIWLFDSWRDLYIWIYRTQFGDISSNPESFILPLTSINDFYGRLYTQIYFGGLIPIMFVLFFAIIGYFVKIKYRIKLNSKIHLYLLISIIIPLITVLISISNTPRKFALIYIIFSILCYVYIILLKKINNLIYLPIILIIIIQYASIYSLITKKPLGISQFVTGTAITEPTIEKPIEKKIANIINKFSLKYKFNDVSLSWTHPDINIDIFTTAMLLNLNSNKNYNVHLPVFFKKYNQKELYRILGERDAIFIINPNGNMNFSKKQALIYQSRLVESELPQEKFYNELLYLYFSKKLKEGYNFISVECIDLSYNNLRREGCLLVKN
tara:strand:- start:2585 stop:4510 length:1926 start_codon:yes stop_codon:yes gene_type:complete